MPNGDTGGMTPAQIQDSLSGVDYPAMKNDLISAARDSGASDKVISMLQRLPDQSYETPADVTQALSNLM